MRGDNHPQRLALNETRDRVERDLSEAFAKDELSLEEFERRVERLQNCASVAELRELTADLGLRQPNVRVATPGHAVPATPAAPAPAAALAHRHVRLGRRRRRRRRRGEAALAILGSTERAPRGLRDGRLHAVSVLGSVELDLRELELPPGTTDIQVVSVLGSVEITVPPDMPVECDGFGVLGSFDGAGERAGQPNESRLRVRGVSVLGSVEVRVRARRQTP